jgi:hypothetical protein
MSVPYAVVRAADAVVFIGDVVGIVQQEPVITGVRTAVAGDPQVRCVEDIQTIIVRLSSRR